MSMPLQQIPYGTPQNAYKHAAVETASPGKILVMLYSGAIKFLKQAESALLEKRYEDAHHSLVRVGDIITELNATLNLEQGGEIAANLRQLYIFYYGEVVKANTKKDPAYLKSVIEFFESFRDVWMQTVSQARLETK